MKKKKSKKAVKIKKTSKAKSPARRKAPAKAKTKVRVKTQLQASRKIARTEKPIGAVTHFFGHIKVAIVKFSKPVKVGVKISFRGATTDFSQAIVSMQFNHKPIQIAKPKMQVGIKVAKRVREGDSVYLAQ